MSKNGSLDDKTIWYFHFRKFFWLLIDQLQCFLHIFQLIVWKPEHMKILLKQVTAFRNVFGCLQFVSCQHPYFYIFYLENTYGLSVSPWLFMEPSLAVCPKLQCLQSVSDRSQAQRSIFHIFTLFIFLPKDSLPVWISGITFREWFWLQQVKSLSQLMSICWFFLRVWILDFLQVLD